MDYLQFLNQKTVAGVTPPGILDIDVSDQLFPFQKEVVRHLLSIGRAAAFLDTGLGKTIIQLEWSRHIDGDVLIVAPLAVAQQTIAEGKRLLGLDIHLSKDGTRKGKYTITNYDRIDKFDAEGLHGVVLDESSILKGQNSKTKKLLIDKFSDVPYRLACTATPAPNDYTEIGNHAEFLGIMNTQEMLMRWFIHDSMNTADWRIKGHARESFWRWVASWAACVSKPSDLGYDDSAYQLPPLSIDTITVDTPLLDRIDEGLLFDIPTPNATSLHAAKRHTIEERVSEVARLVNNSEEPWIVWCESNEESAALHAAIPDSVEVKGSDSSETKETRMIAFSEGRARVIVSKPSICGFGMNWQHCNKIAFASISYSYEKFYQAIRRSWRFGQTRPVDVYVIIADAELTVWRVIETKSQSHDEMKSEMRHASFKSAAAESIKIPYLAEKTAPLPEWI